MNNQELMDLRKQCVDAIVKVNETAMPKELKGAPNGKEVSKREGYILAMQNVIKMIDNRRN